MSADRWNVVEAGLARRMAMSDEWAARNGPANLAEIDQSVAACRQLLIAHGVNVHDRDELLAVAAGVFLAVSSAHSFMSTGLFDSSQFADVDIVTGYTLALLVRLLPAQRRSWRLVFDERPFTLNGERKVSRWQRAADVRRWRDAFAVLAKAERIPPLDRVTVEIRPLFHTAASMQDVAGCVPAAKAAIDGLVDARVIPDDGPDHLTGQLYRPPLVDRGRRTDGLELIIREEPS